MKFILLINVKMPTIVGILTFISMINTSSERHKARRFFICRYFSFYVQLIRQICSIKPEDVASVSELLAKLQLEDLDLILRERRLRWFGHVAHSSGAIRTAYDMQIDGKRGAGRPKQTWKKLTEKDCREWKLTTVDPQERSTWRSGVRSAMCAASQLPGKGPTDVDDAPAPAR